MNARVTIDGWDDWTSVTPDRIPTMPVLFLARRWNGWQVPVVRAHTFRAFIAGCQQADPNGTWGRVYEGKDRARRAGSGPRQQRL